MPQNIFTKIAELVISFSLLTPSICLRKSPNSRPKYSLQKHENCGNLVDIFRFQKVNYFSKTTKARERIFIQSDTTLLCIVTSNRLNLKLEIYALSRSESAFHSSLWVHVHLHTHSHTVRSNLIWIWTFVTLTLSYIPFFAALKILSLTSLCW